MSSEDILRGIFGDEPQAASQPKLRVPSNLVPVIEAVERETGVPFEIIAGVVQTNGTTGTSGDWPGGITPELIVDVALRLQKSVPAGGADAGNWRIAARNAFGGGRPTWTDRFDSIVYPKQKDGSYDYQKPQWIEREPQQAIGGKTRIPDLGGGVGGGYVYPGGEGPVGPQPVDIADVYSAFDSFVGRPPAEAEAQQYVGLTGDALRASLLSLPEARTFREFGERIGQTRRWMDSIWFDHYGRAPSNDEVIGVINGKYTPDSLERKVRNEPIGETTRGQYADVRKEANDWAQEFLGRDADEAEINWIIANLGQKDAKGKVTRGPTKDQVSGFYEQLKTRMDSGDESFAWVKDPVTWRRTKEQVQQIWTEAGLVGESDPRLVNKMLSEGWTLDDAQAHIYSLPAPGFPTGITVGEVNRVREYASKWKEHYLPGDPLTNAEMTRFIAMAPEEVQGYYRQMPLGSHLESLRRAKQFRDQPVTEATEPIAARGERVTKSEVMPGLHARGEAPEDSFTEYVGARPKDGGYIGIYRDPKTKKTQERKVSFEGSAGKEMR